MSKQNLKKEGDRARARMVKEGVPWWISLTAMGACWSGYERVRQMELRAKRRGKTITLEYAWRNLNNVDNVVWLGERLTKTDRRRAQKVLEAFAKDKRAQALLKKCDPAKGRLDENSRCSPTDRYLTASVLTRLLGYKFPTSVALVRAYTSAFDAIGFDFEEAHRRVLTKDLKWYDHERVLHWERLIDQWRKDGKTPTRAKVLHHE